MSNNSGGEWGFWIFILLLFVFFPSVFLPLGVVFAPLNAISNTIGDGWMAFGSIVLGILLIVIVLLLPRPDLKTQGKMFCPTCKQIISLNAASCPHCGEPIKKETN